MNSFPLLMVSTILNDQFLVASVSLGPGSQSLLGFDPGICSQVNYELDVLS